MAFLTLEQAEALSGSTVRMATLVELQFKTKTTYLWNGFGSVYAAGYEWQGLGNFGSIDGLPQIREPVSTKVIMKLSGVSAEILAVAKATTDEVKGRPAYVWAQLFDSDWKVVGARIPLFWGIMQRLNVARTEGSETDGGERSCELEVENPFYARARPSAGRFTDADQQFVFPGDRFFRFVPNQRSQVITWPDY